MNLKIMAIYSLVGIFLAIPIAFFLAFLIWFFADVVGSAGIGYLVLARWLYVVCVTIDLLSTVYFFGNSSVAAYRLRKRWNISGEEMYLAIVKLDLHQEDGFKLWTGEEFRQWFSRKKAVSALADAIFSRMKVDVSL